MKRIQIISAKYRRTPWMENFNCVVDKLWSSKSIIHQNGYVCEAVSCLNIMINLVCVRIQKNTSQQQTRKDASAPPYHTMALMSLTRNNLDIIQCKAHRHKRRSANRGCCQQQATHHKSRASAHGQRAQVYGSYRISKKHQKATTTTNIQNNHNESVIASMNVYMLLKSDGLGWEYHSLCLLFSLIRISSGLYIRLWEWYSLYKPMRTWKAEIIRQIIFDG